MKNGKKTLSVLLSFLLLLGVCSAGFTVSAGPAAGQEYELKGLDPDAAAVKPTLTISSETLGYDAAMESRIRDVTLSVQGAAYKYGPTGFHIQFDPRLKIVTKTVGGKTVYAQLGDAGESLFSDQKGDGDNGFYIATAATDDDGQDGVLWKFQVELPEDIALSGATFPIEIAYKTSPSAPDMFTNADKNEQGELMQAYVFTRGIQQGGITVRAAAKTVSASAAPAIGGTVTGGGTYDYNTSARLIASPKDHYRFVNWTENGNVVSTSEEYSFTVTENRVLVANFEKETFTITFANEDGTVLQSGSVPYGETPAYKGETPTKEPTAQYTYEFLRWTPEITEATEDATYTATYTAIPVYTDVPATACEFCGETHDTSTFTGFFTDLLHDMLYVVIRLVRFFTYELFV